MPSVLHWQDVGVKCAEVLTWHITCFVKGIWKHVIQIFDAMDRFVVL